MRRASLLLFAAWLLPAQPPTGSIHGVVKDAVTGEPLPYFRMQIIPSTAPAAAVSVHVRQPPDPVTDEQGRYSAANIPAGRVTVLAHNPRRQSATREIELKPGDDLAVDFEIPPNPTVSGRVVNQNNQPVSGVQVWVVEPGNAHGVDRYSLMGPQVTDKQGHYSFDFAVTAGRKFYLLADRRPPEKLVGAEPKPPEERESIDAPTYYGNVPTLDAAAPLVLLPGEQRTGADIKIMRTPYFCADGLIDAFGSHAALPFQVHDRALAATSVVSLQGMSGKDGAFRVCGLTSREYMILAGAPDGTIGSADFAVLDADVHQLSLNVDSASLHLELAWDGDPPPRRDRVSQGLMRLVHTGDAWVEKFSDGTEVKVQEAAARALLARVETVSVDLTRTADFSTSGKSSTVPFEGDLGRFSAGDYRVSVGLSPDCCFLKTLLYNGVPLSEPALRLLPGNNGTLRVLLGANDARLICSVTDTGGKPLSGFTLLLFPDKSDKPLSQQMSLGDNPLTWYLPAGKYRLLAIDRPSLTADETDKAIPALSKATSVELPSKGTATVNITAISID